MNRYTEKVVLSENLKEYITNKQMYYQCSFVSFSCKEYASFRIAGDVGSVVTLLSYCADVNAPDKKGVTALMKAIQVTSGQMLS